MKRRCFVLILATGISSILIAQPEVFINNDDVPFLIGQWATYDQNQDLFFWEPFDSMRLWWDLTVYPGGASARVHLLDPLDGDDPAPDTFPLAEIVEIDSISGNAVWNYLSETAFFFFIQGIDMTQLTYRFIGNYQPDYRCYTYPVYDGAGWNTAWTWSYEVLPGLTYTATEQHIKTVVAKGKVKVPFSGNHFWPCFVIRDYMTYSDTWGYSDTRWIYEWIVPGRFGGANGVAAAQSTSGASQDFILVENFFNLSELYVPGWDLRCPDFSSTVILTDTTYAGPYIVSSTITDSTGIGADSLFYNIDGGQFLGVGSDSTNGDVYYYTIPAVVQSCAIGYFLWAEDSFSVANSVDIWNTDPICAPESTYYSFNVTTGIQELTQHHIGMTALSCSPNPFKQITEIIWQTTDSRLLINDNSLQLKIYNAAGRLMRSFPIDQLTNQSIYRIIWNGTDDSGRQLANGIYFVELKADGIKIVKPVVMIK